MTEILTAQHSGLKGTPKHQESRLKGHWLQDDTDSKEVDKLLSELNCCSEQHVHGFYQYGFSYMCDGYIGVEGCEHGTKAGKSTPTPSELDSNLTMIHSQSKVKEMSVAENVDKNVQYSRTFKYGTQQVKQSMHTVKKVCEQVVDSKHSKCNGVHENKPQACVNMAKSKSRTSDLLSILVNDKHNSKPAVVSGDTVPTATLSLAELAKQHRSQRATATSAREVLPVSKASVEDMANVSSTTFHHRDLTAGHVVGSLSNCSDSFVGRLESSNHEKLSKHNTTSMPSVVGCSSSAGSLTEVPAYSQSAGKSSGLSLSQLAQQHRHSKSPLSTLSPHNGYVNGCKPSLLSLMKNVVIDDSKTSTAAEAPLSKVTSKEPVSSLSLTLCLKLTKASDTTPTKLPCKQPKQDTDDLAVGTTFSQTDSQLCQSREDSQEQEIPTDLIPQVSSVGFVLFCLKRKRKLEVSSSKIGNAFKYPKFKCSTQVGNRNLYPESVYHKIKPFDFSTPSPDDMVKHKQKQAFTRPQKEFEL